MRAHLGCCVRSLPAVSPALLFPLRNSRPLMIRLRKPPLLYIDVSFEETADISSVIFFHLSFFSSFPLLPFERYFRGEKEFSSAIFNFSNEIYPPLHSSLLASRDK